MPRVAASMDAEFLEKTMNLFKLQEGLQKTCAVCHEVAHSCNFGVITCDPCKAFFRRNANKESITECTRKCQITGRLRSSCQSCRLRKCFDKGMKKELILNDEMKAQRKRKIEENKMKRLAIGSPPPSKQSSPSSSTLSSPLPQSPDSSGYQHHDRTSSRLRTSQSCGTLSDAIRKQNHRPQAQSHTYSSKVFSKPTAGGNYFDFEAKPEVHGPGSDNHHCDNKFGQSLAEPVFTYESYESRPACSYMANNTVYSVAPPTSPLEPSPRNASCPAAFHFQSYKCGSSMPVFHQPPLEDSFNGASPSQGNSHFYPQNYPQMAMQDSPREGYVPSSEYRMYCGPYDMESDTKPCTGCPVSDRHAEDNLCSKRGLSRIAHSCPSLSQADQSQYPSGLPSCSFAHRPLEYNNTYPVSSSAFVKSEPISGQSTNLQPGSNSHIADGMEVLKNDHGFIARHCSVVSEGSLNSPTISQYFSSVETCTNKDHGARKCDVDAIKQELPEEGSKVLCYDCDYVASWVRNQPYFEAMPQLQDITHNIMSTFSGFLQKATAEPKQCLRFLGDVPSAYEECIREGVKLTKQLKPFQEMEKLGQIELLKKNLLDLVHLLFLHLYDTEKLLIPGKDVDSGQCFNDNITPRDDRQTSTSPCSGRDAGVTLMGSPITNTSGGNHHVLTNNLPTDFPIEAEQTPKENVATCTRVKTNEASTGDQTTCIRGDYGPVSSRDQTATGNIHHSFTGSHTPVGMNQSGFDLRENVCTEVQDYVQQCGSSRLCLAPIQSDTVIQSCVMAIVLFAPKTDGDHDPLVLQSEFVSRWHGAFWRVLQTYLTQQYPSNDGSHLLCGVEDFLVKNAALGDTAKRMFSLCPELDLSPLIVEAFGIHSA